MLNPTPCSTDDLESEEAESAAAKSDSAGVPSTTTGGNGSATKTSSRSSSTSHSGDGEFDPIGWVMEDPLRAAISAVLVTIILLYSWSLVKKLFGSSMVSISKKRLVQLEKYEAMFLKHGAPKATGGAVVGGGGAGAGGTPVGKVTTQTIIKKIVQPKTT
jgi:hypothetical protein